jgi:DtxR family Mn-dependent transcriptional regulator
MSTEPRDPETSTTVDRYLETIYCISGEGEIVRPSRLAQWLEVSAPTVSEAIRRLARDGWIVIASDRSVSLTDIGDTKASNIVRRHRILERWLTETLGFDWVAADEEADRLSSVISNDVIDRIDETLSFPLTCPHGNPIPGRSPEYGALVALADLEPGTSGRVRRISEVADHQARSLLTSLHEAGITEGSEVRVSPSGGDTSTISLNVEGRILSMPLESARWIWVDTVS